ncbi:serine/threonine-protein kinase [Actinomadura macrotermitis]|uniref:Serine/threonine-protein kinase PknD n=1 Tax=Actinomadura macrotermitis TaxID=2585200 RepID=A0A7K0BP80_9ACTN|nr:serine/threonine-protein kinase [Actinomadura macrotermitis]MQY02937.1 Serine/threonine-protein kinase PknD [Actinomadura macrotermitis]
MSVGEALRPDDPVRLGSYRLTGRLGEGGQGVVYRAEAPGGGPVAVKLLRTGLEPGSEARARFLRELDAAKRVARFCTAAVLDADVDGAQPFIVSEFVDGPSLSQVVRAEGPRSGGALERLAVGTATALAAIHQAGIVHRDFKPHNVLLGPDGPRVIDFGIARALDGATITADGMIGTPAYMAPEQVAGERAGPPADVFAWGSTVVFAACGRPPFGSDALHAVLLRIRDGEPDLGGLTGALGALVARCLDKDPARRPKAAEVLRALLGEEAPPALVAPAPAPPARRRRGKRVAVAAAGTIAVVAAAAGVVLMDQDDAAPPKPRPAVHSPAPLRFPEKFAGKWKGTLEQSNGTKLTVSLVLPAGEARGRVSYAKQRCSGVATLVKQGPEALTLHEEITVRADRCVDSGTILLSRQAAGRMGFSYFGRENGRTWAVAGTLSRR